MTNKDRYGIWDKTNRFFAKLPGPGVHNKSTGRVNVVISSYESDTVYNIFLNYDIKNTGIQVIESD